MQAATYWSQSITPCPGSRETLLYQPENDGEYTLQVTAYGGETGDFVLAAGSSSAEPTEVVVGVTTTLTEPGSTIENLL